MADSKNEIQQLPTPQAEIQTEDPKTSWTSNPEELKNAKRITYFIWDLPLSKYIPGWVLWILMSYLTGVRKESLIHAAATVNVFDASTAFLSVLATISVNTWPGLYFTTLLSTVTYATGLGLLWREAITGEFNNTLFYVALLLTATGKAGTGVTFKPFYDRLNKRRATAATFYEERVLNWEMWALYLVGVILLVVGDILLPYTLKSWKILFGVASLSMMFVSYKLLRGRFGNILVDTDDNKHVPQNKNIVKDDKVDSTDDSTGWELIKMFPMWATFLVPALICSVGTTYFVEQADSMSTKVFGYVPVSVPMLFMTFTVSLNAAGARYKRQRRDPEMNIIKKYIGVKDIGQGMFWSIVCCVISALVERRRASVAHKHKHDSSNETIPMSIFWLYWQFSLLGYIYGNMRYGVRGFLSDQLPKKLQRYADLLTDITFGLGTLLSVLVVFAAQTISTKSHIGGHGSGWFGRTIKTTRLHYFYWTLAILSALNLLLFLLFLRIYDLKEASEEAEEGEDEDGDEEGNGNPFYYGFYSDFFPYSFTVAFVLYLLNLGLPYVFKPVVVVYVVCLVVYVRFADLFVCGVFLGLVHLVSFYLPFLATTVVTFYLGCFGFPYRLNYGVVLGFMYLYAVGFPSYFGLVVLLLLVGSLFF